MIKFVSHKELAAIKEDIKSINRQMDNFREVLGGAVFETEESTYTRQPVTPVVTKGAAVGSAYDNVKVETKFEVRLYDSALWHEAPIQHLREIRFPHYLRIRVGVDFGHQGTIRYFPDMAGVFVQVNK